MLLTKPGIVPNLELMKFRIRWILATCLAGTLVVLIIILFGPDMSLRQYSKLADQALSSHNEKSLYSLESQVERLDRFRLNPVQKRFQNLIMGRIQFGKAVFLPEGAGIRTLYLDQAERYFRMAEGGKGDSAEALFWLGMCATRRGERGQNAALDYLIRSLRLGFPDGVKILKILNYIYLKKGEYSIIIRINEEFLKKRYFDLDIIYSLGKAHTELGHFEQALPILGLATNSVVAGNQLILKNVFFELGRCRYGLQDYVSAASNFGKALRMDKDSNAGLGMRAAEYYALSLFRLGDGRSAGLLDAVVRAGSHNPEVLKLDGELKGH